MIQAKIFGMIIKMVLKHPAIIELFDYKDKPNELDMAVAKQKKELESIKFKVNAMRDLFKDIQSQINDIVKIAHVPKDFSKEIDRKINIVKNDITKIRTSTNIFTDIIKKMKKNPLLKPIFK